MDIERLMLKIKENGGVSKVAREAGMHPATLYRQLKGTTPNIGQAKKLGEIMHFTKRDYNEIYFDL